MKSEREMIQWRGQSRRRWQVWYSQPGSIRKFISSFHDNFGYTYRRFRVPHSIGDIITGRVIRPRLTGKLSHEGEITYRILEEVTQAQMIAIAKEHGLPKPPKGWWYKTVTD